MPTVTPVLGDVKWLSEIMKLQLHGKNAMWLIYLEGIWFIGIECAKTACSSWDDPDGWVWNHSEEMDMILIWAWDDTFSIPVWKEKGTDEAFLLYLCCVMKRSYMWNWGSEVFAFFPAEDCWHSPLPVYLLSAVLDVAHQWSCLGLDFFFFSGKILKY